MKKIVLLMIAAMMLISLVGCGVANVEMLPTEEALPEAQLPEAELPVETAPPEQPESTAEQQTFEEHPWVGIWSSAEGQQTDSTAEYHNYYICLFDNGTALRYGWRLMDAGSWTLNEQGGLSAIFENNYAHVPGDGWTKSANMDILLFAMENDTLLITEAAVEGEFSYRGTYYPANRTDAYEKCLSMIDLYQTCGNEIAQDQYEINMHNGAAASMYSGLELLMYQQLVQSLPEAEAEALEEEEITWSVTAKEAVTAAGEEYEEGSMASAARSTKHAELAKARIQELLEKEAPSQHNVFAELPKTLTFMSGLGGWSTDLSIAPDGTFSGQYADYDLGVTGEDFPNGSCRISNFTGKFTQPEQLDDYTWAMNLEKLEVAGTVGESYIENLVQYTVADPYGFDQAETFYLYVPGKPISAMPEEFLYWAQCGGCPLVEIEAMPEGWYGLYNEGGQTGFVGSQNSGVK